MKILCVIDSLGSGGAQRQLVNLSIGFKERGHDVKFLVYHEENFFKKVLDDAGIQIDYVIETSYFRRLLKIRRYIRRGNFDGVLSFLEAANFICEISGLPWRKWRLVVGERSANPKIFKSIKLRFYRWFHVFADYVVSNSYENLSMVRKINPLLPLRKCKVIYNMLDFDVWKPDPGYIPLKDGKLHLIVAASHQYLKNAIGLINAVQALNDLEKSKLRIDWYGDERTDNSYNDSLDLIEKYSIGNIIVFHKAIQDIHQKMKYADVIGLFSFYEGLPNAVCEGIALGKTIISSNVSDIPLLIKNDKLLFNPNKTNEISEALAYVISLEKEEILEIGEENMVINGKLFQKEPIVSDYLNLLT